MSKDILISCREKIQGYVCHKDLRSPLKTEHKLKARIRIRRRPIRLLNVVCKPSGGAFSCFFFLIFITIFIFLSAPRPTLGHYRVGSLTNRMLITAFVTYSTRRPRNEVGSQNSSEHLVRFEPGYFRFWK